MPKIKPSTSAFGVDDVPKLVTEYKNADALAKQAADRAADFKKELKILLERFGELDDKGNKWIPVEDLDGVKEGVKYEKRTSRTLNVEKLTAYLKQRKLWLDATSTVTQIDEGKLWALVWDGKITEAKMESFTEETITWAMRIV